VVVEDLKKLDLTKMEKAPTEEEKLKQHPDYATLRAWYFELTQKSTETNNPK
jgi:hypothetical protein